MNKIIADFENQYPRSASMARDVSQMPNLSNQMALWISLNVSVLMAKLKRGDFNKYLKNGDEVPVKVIDVFGENYLMNIKNIGTQVWEMTGNYEMLKQSQSLNPDNFVKRIIDKYCD